MESCTSKSNWLRTTLAYDQLIQKQAPQVDLTDIPNEAYTDKESPPDLDGLDSLDTLFKSGPIRERLLDVVVGLRTPTKVSRIAD